MSSSLFTSSHHHSTTPSPRLPPIPPSCSLFCAHRAHTSGFTLAQTGSMMPSPLVLSTRAGLVLVASGRRIQGRHWPNCIRRRIDHLQFNAFILANGDLIPEDESCDGCLPHVLHGDTRRICLDIHRLWRGVPRHSPLFVCAD